MLDAASHIDHGFPPGREEVVIPDKLVIAPATGRFHPLPPEVFTTEGEWIETGQVMANIDTGSEIVPVVSLFQGWLMGMFAIAGCPVQAGEKLFCVRAD